MTVAVYFLYILATYRYSGTLRNHVYILGNNILSFVHKEDLNISPSTIHYNDSHNILFHIQRYRSHFPGHTAQRSALPGNSFPGRSGCMFSHTIPRHNHSYIYRISGHKHRMRMTDMQGLYSSGHMFHYTLGRRIQVHILVFGNTNSLHSNRAPF